MHACSRNFTDRGRARIMANATVRYRSFAPWFPGGPGAAASVNELAAAPFAPANTLGPPPGFDPATAAAAADEGEALQAAQPAARTVAPMPARFAARLAAAAPAPAAPKQPPQVPAPLAS